MVARKAQGWTWEAIAEEAGLSVRTVKEAVKNRQAGAPLQFNADPVRVVEEVFQAYQLSIGDLEAIAAEAARSNQLAIAVGAKRSANDAREKVLTLLQMTGRLPQELGSLRHLIDLRAIAVRMLDVMDGFDRDLAGLTGLEDAAERERLGREAAARVRTTFNELLGIEAPVPDGSALEGTAV
jgi:transcriptional regulator with XRE-family HTH domain